MDDGLLRYHYRSISDERMQVFFKHDFTEDRWRKAALKNAYALLGLQRFTHAAAFFLLAGSIKDAIEVRHRIVYIYVLIVRRTKHTSLYYVH